MKNTILFISMLVLLVTGCEKDEAPFDPKNAILGKWELVQQGTSLDVLFDVPSQGYTEYLDDKSYRYYDYETEEYTYGDYTLNDSLLIYYNYAVENGEIMDTIPIRYFHTFRDRRILILDIDALAIFDFFIYKKIE